MSEQNRETWLISAVEVLREGLFAPRGVVIPQLKLSVGLPHARNQRKVKVQYFPPDANADGVACVFVSPLLDDGSLIIGNLYSLLRTTFAPLAHTLPTFTQDMSDEFMQALGAYPSAALKLPETDTQSTRMLKLQCPECGYTVRATQRWISQRLPLCTCQASNPVFKVIDITTARDKTESSTDNDELPF